MKKIALITIASLAVLTVLHLKPWRGSGGKQLVVGFLPVTCHLTCPVTDFATKTTTTGTRFVSRRFTDFPTVVESLKSGDISASFILAPLAMKLVEEGVPIKIVYLGHRDGSEVIVPKNSTATSLRDLRGKTFAIPNKASNQYLVLLKLMEDQGMNDDDINFVEMAPPDMPAALSAGAIDAYFVGEPHAAKAEVAGFGRVLYYAKDIWPQFVSCVLVVTQDLIDRHPDMVRDLVRGIASSGMWAETHRVEAAQVAAPYFQQDEKLVEYVLTTPPDRVSYVNLTPTDDDLAQIMKYAVKAGVLDHPIDLTKVIDREFIPDHIEPAQIAVAQ